MITTLMTLLLVAQAGDPDDLRKTYSNCVVDMTIESLKSNMGERTFKNAASKACSAERAAYVDAIAKDEMEYGSNEDEAKQFAEEEADTVVAAMVNSYGDFKSTSTQPTKED